MSAGEIIANRRLVSDRADLLEKPVADGVVGVGVDGMRPLIAENALEPAHGAFDVELRRGVDGRRREQRRLQHHGREEKGGDRNQRDVAFPDP